VAGALSPTASDSKSRAADLSERIRGDPALRQAFAGEVILAVVGDQFASELAHQLSPEGAHHVFGAEVERAVLEQSGHQVVEVFALAEEDIRRILGLRRHPLVLHRPQQLAEQRIDPPGIAP
jgi:hypothetical protein